MNAHSKVDKERQSVVSKRLRSKAFRDGFKEGFAAPGLLFGPIKFRRAASIDASVAAAWKAVGKALDKGTAKEARRIVKATGKIARVD